MSTARTDVGHAAALAEQFAEAGGIVLDPADVRYPTAMSDRTGHPPLYVLGDPGVLSLPGIGLCGSRSAGPAGLSLAQALGRLAANLGAPLISGYAKGVDSAGHAAAIESGGTTTAVLAEGIARFSLQPEYSHFIDPLDQMIVVSQYPAQARWTVINAMERNRTIVSLSHLLVAVEPGEKGGTLNAAQEALRQDVPLIVALPGAEHAPAHVDRLVKRGATLVQNEHELRDAVARSIAADARQPIGQAALFDAEAGR